jgi:hypothetical protein
LVAQLIQALEHPRGRFHLSQIVSSGEAVNVNQVQMIGRELGKLADLAIGIVFPPEHHGEISSCKAQNLSPRAAWLYRMRLDDLWASLLSASLPPASGPFANAQSRRPTPLPQQNHEGDKHQQRYQGDHLQWGWPV